MIKLCHASMHPGSLGDSIVVFFGAPDIGGACALKLGDPELARATENRIRHAQEQSRQATRTVTSRWWTSALWWRQWPADSGTGTGDNVHGSFHVHVTVHVLIALAVGRTCMSELGIGSTNRRERLVAGGSHCACDKGRPQRLRAQLAQSGPKQHNRRVYRDRDREWPRLMIRCPGRHIHAL